MDQSLRDFQVGGLASAVEVWDHQVTVFTSPETNSNTLILRGVQADVEVNPEDLQQFGFSVKRTFSLVVPDSPDVRLVKSGMRATTPLGETLKVLWIKRDILGTRFIFGSVNQ